MILSTANYLIRSGISLALLWLFFQLFLSRERFLKFNRIYLVFSLVFSFVVPLLSFPVILKLSEKAVPLEIKYFQDSFYQLQVSSDSQSGSINFNSVIVAVYIVVSAFLLIRFLNNIIRLKIREHRNPAIRLDGHKIVLLDDLVLPYSFFSTVFLNSREYREGSIPGALLHHEFAHLDQRHSADIIFIELLRVVFWINPILILYKKAIMLNHEYLADEAAEQSDSNIFYQDILLKIVFHKNNSYLASSFDYSFTKKRLLMMTKKKIPKMAILKKMVAIPIFAMVGLLVLDAQDPPPPPPPPPPELSQSFQNTWWAPIANRYNFKPDPATNWYSQDMFETGSGFSLKNDVVTTKESFIIARNDDKSYAIIRAKSGIHDLKKNEIILQDSKIEFYRINNDTSKLFTTGWIKNFNLRIVDGKMFQPPPPPPPPPPGK